MSKKTITLQAKVTLFVLVMFYLLSFMDKQIFALLINPIGISLSLSDMEMGTLHGLAYSIFYVSGVLLAGFCVDRFGARRILFAAVLFWSTAALLSGLAVDFFSMFAARGAVGLGEAFLPPAAYALLAAAFPRDRLAFANGIYHAGASVGGVISLVFGGALIGTLTRMGGIELPGLGRLEAWQGVLICTGLPGMFLAFLAFLLPARRPQVKTIDKAEQLIIEPLLPFLKLRGRLVAYHVWSVATLATLAYALVSWSPAFLEREYRWPAEQIGLVLAIGVGIGGVGNIFWGWVCDRVFRMGYNDAPYRVFIIATLIGIPAIAAAFLSGWQSLFPFFYAVGWFAASSFGPLITSVQLFSPPTLRGRIIAIQTCFVGIFAIGLTPVIVAGVAEYLFSGRDDLGPAIAVTCVLFGLLGVLGLMLGSGPLRRAVESENELEVQRGNI